MTDAHNHFPLTTAIAAGTGACVRRSRKIGWLPGMADRLASFPAILIIDCGVSR